MKDLTTEDLARLADLLRLPPGQLPTTVWFESQAARLQHFPQPLLRSTSLLHRLIYRTPYASQRAERLCETHEVLDAHVIHEIFSQVSAEGSFHIKRLIENSSLPEDIRDMVMRLQQLQCLRLVPNVQCHRLLNILSHDDRGLGHIPSGCEACILAAIGGNRQILSDLRASILGRRKRRAPVPELLRLLNAWIRCSDSVDTNIRESEILARHVNRCRKEMQLARREDKSASSDEGRVVSTPALGRISQREGKARGHGMCDSLTYSNLKLHDTQQKLIAKQRSTQHGDDTSQSGIHGQPISDDQHSMRQDCIKSISIYSNDTHAGEREPVFEFHQQSSAARAQEYIALLRRGILEDVSR